MAKGIKTGGRSKGTLNKATASAKAAIEQVFTGMGGPEALQLWALSDPDNTKAFYTSIWPKILPLQVNGSGEEGEHVFEFRWQS